jgi:hypothetical protein
MGPLPFSMVQSHADRIRAGLLRWRGVPPGIPPAIADDFMSKLKAGSTVRKLTAGGKKLGPSIVRRDRLKKHCDVHPEWAAEAWRISRVNARIGNGACIRNRTHCVNGHSFAAFGRVVMHKGYMTRQCRACEYARSRRGDKMKPGILEKVDACRRVHSKKPRRSKNGTPEERAAKAAALYPTSADVVPMADAQEQARSEVDGRTLKGSPLRDSVATVSYGATVVGKMHTAGLKGEPLVEIPAEIRKEWFQTLDRAFEAMCTLAGGLSRAMQTLKALESETSDFPLNLPDLGQLVLNLAAEHDQ